MNKILLSIFAGIFSLSVAAQEPTLVDTVFFRLPSEITNEYLDSITLTMNTVGTHLFAAKRANFQCVLDTVAASQAVTVNAIPEIVVTGNNVICQNDTAMWVATGVAAGATHSEMT